MRPLWMILIALGLPGLIGLVVWAIRARLRNVRRMAGGTNDWQARALLAEQRAAQAETVVRAGLLPQLARLLRGRLVVGLLSQRSQLLNTQQKSAERVTNLEQRLAAAHGRLENRLQQYERRIDELQNQGPDASPLPTPTPGTAPPPPPPPAPRRNPFRSQPAAPPAGPVRFSAILHRKQQSATHQTPNAPPPPDPSPPSSGKPTG